MDRNVVPVNAASHTRAPLKTLGRDLVREYDRIVDSVFNTVSSKMNSEAALSPSVDVVGCDKQIEVVADLPGVDEKHIKVELRDGSLYISGAREMPAKQADVKMYSEERSTGSFERSVALPCDVDKSAVEASFKDGVLRVILPKTAEARKEVMRIHVKH